MLSDLHRFNLTILADYLIELPVDYRHFEMRVYNGYTDLPAQTEGRNLCNTSACAVGHVPYTGIVGWERQEDWNQLALNLLGADPFNNTGPFVFMFGDNNVDCPWAAALRIRHFLATGSVDGFEYPHGLTLEQYQNLRRLAAYLIALPKDYEDFDMGWWTADYRSPGTTACGTVACAGGHGPMAGIAPQPGECWATYINRAFVEGNNPLSDYMFSAGWTEHDNTPQGAGKRILYALHNGIPENEYDPTVYGG